MWRILAIACVLGALVGGILAFANRPPTSDAPEAPTPPVQNLSTTKAQPKIKLPAAKIVATPTRESLPSEPSTAVVEDVPIDSGPAVSVQTPCDSATGQAPRAVAVVAAKAPVFVYPQRLSDPITTLNTGARLSVLDRKGDWYRAEFRDPRWGLRVGYVHCEHVVGTSDPRAQALVVFAERESSVQPPTERRAPVAATP